ncbi:MAG TPA: prolyl oligopeptidase family serine peptidase [Roseiflexaceae bacterium]|nr:prolyl oligopeptidase family serine peptidase [Roseiflexaceae bacterium]
MTQSTRRDAILQRLGRFPERVPLAATLGLARDMGDHTRALVSYDVEAGERIDAWLLCPRGQAPAAGWPAILALHQHGGEFYLGKSQPAGLSADNGYHYGLELCRRGYVVLCPDHLCFEDRRPPEYVRVENGYLKDQGYERFEFKRRLLEGSCLQTKYLHDMVCGLDLLAELPAVDAARLGAIGHSLGGQEALWLAWYDERVRAAVSSCGFGLIRTIIRDGITHNYAMYVPGLLEIGDTDALLAEIAPRAFLLTAGEQDAIFPIDGVRAVAAAAQAVYARAGVADRFRAVIFPAGHSFPDQVKAEAYAFLDRWLRE